MKKKYIVVQIAMVQYPHDPRSILRCAGEISKYYPTLLIARKGVPAGSYEHKEVPFFKSILLRALLVHPRVFWKCLMSNAKVYHFHNPELIPTFLLLSMFGKEIIFDVHENVVGQLRRRKRNSGNIFIHLYKLFIRLAKKHFHFILAEDSYREDFRKVPKEVRVVHNFPDRALLPLVKHKPLEAKSRLFYIGGIGTQRGLAEMVGALFLLQDEIPSLGLDLVGPVYENASTLEQIPYYPSVADKILFHGPLPGKEALKLCDDAIAGLAILEDTPNYRNSYPSKIFEYMCIGLPFICSDFPLYKQIAGKAGITIPSGDIQALAGAIRTIKSDRSKWEAMSEECLRLSAMKYNWQKEKQELHSLYHSLGLRAVS